MIAALAKIRLSRRKAAKAGFTAGNRPDAGSAEAAPATQRQALTCRWQVAADSNRLECRWELETVIEAADEHSAAVRSLSWLRRRGGVYAVARRPAAAARRTGADEDGSRHRSRWVRR